MSDAREFRAHERVPVSHGVQVAGKGRLAACGLALNLSLGGILLSAAVPLPVGSRCQVAIPLPDGSSQGLLKAAGMVVRSDNQGTAIKFTRPLAEPAFRALTQGTPLATSLPLLQAYSDYFKVSRSSTYENCESLLGVSKETFKTVFTTTFFGCIGLALVPAWLLRDSLPTVPVWGKVLLSFGYGGLWLGAVQPSVDVLTLGLLRNRAK